MKLNLRRRSLAILLTAAFLAVFSNLSQAGDDKMVVPAEVAVTPAPVESQDWSIELGSGANFSNVRRSELDGYTQIPAILTAAYKIDDVSLDNFAWGIFRGNTEFLFQGLYGNNVHNPGGEHNLGAINAGPRYNFVQPGWKVVPFVQSLVGVAYAESNPTVDPSGNQHGLGESFNFTFGIGIGARYDINDQWYVRLGAYYTHYSNAGLSEPVHPNRAIDFAGPQLGLGYRF